MVENTPTKDEPPKEDLLASAVQKKKDGIPLLIKELAAYWDCSDRHIERLRDDFDDENKLKQTKIGGLTRFTWENIAEFERTHSQFSRSSLRRYGDSTADFLDELKELDALKNFAEAELQRLKTEGDAERS